MFHEGYSQEDEDKTSPNDLFWFSHNGKIINPDGTSGQNEDLPFENLKMPRQNPFCAIWSCTSPLLCTWRERRLSDCHSEASCGIPQGGVGGGKTHPGSQGRPACSEDPLFTVKEPKGLCQAPLQAWVGGPFRLTCVWPPELRQMAWVSYLWRTHLRAATPREPCGVVWQTAYRDRFP